MIKCVIFDMDGVVVNTEPIGYQANGELFKSLNIVVPDDIYATFIGSSDKNNMQRIKDLYNLEHTREELLDEKYKYYYEVFDKADDLELMAGVKDLIIDLHKNGMKLILASSATKRKIDKVFSRFDLYPYFDEVISGDDFEFSKPHPAIFLEAVAKSGFNKSECVIIEDSANGIKAAKAAGVYCIGYVSGHGLPQDTTGADKVITDFKELSFNKFNDLI
ncbi:ABC transporter ATP-binding protein [Flavobacterium rivuli WB 3.3-2 = DSM 21788]|uniref:ABC transporter ATP-binding protein n=1 Tax=Flavobacterium rivuli WB 3.3-2 = DSM 21788 TaxID=1121895 RepID=A0A0A2M0K8_9FLAO|nr:HAD family phosphatase [Flavobacterium rivuli]KGO85126.1 ABC transporter ATP-binding protein [Flavobacterium rivuli WB 3.3-2 = DSM 21788]